MNQYGIVCDTQKEVDMIKAFCRQNVVDVVNNVEVSGYGAKYYVSMRLTPEQAKRIGDSVDRYCKY